MAIGKPGDVLYHTLLRGCKICPGEGINEICNREVSLHIFNEVRTHEVYLKFAAVRCLIM